LSDEAKNDFRKNAVDAYAAMIAKCPVVATGENERRLRKEADVLLVALLRKEADTLLGAKQRRNTVYVGVELIKLMRAAADELASLRTQLAECERENKVHEKHLNELVDERITELNADGEAFDKEAANALIGLANKLAEGQEWHDIDGTTVSDAVAFIHECIRECNDRLAECEKRTLERAAAIADSYRIVGFPERYSCEEAKDETAECIAANIRALAKEGGA
jgi:hypothetical protein